jgi:aldose sugar dehydrogenase
MAKTAGFPIILWVAHFAVVTLGWTALHPAPLAATEMNIQVDVLTERLDAPWALAFMPDGRLLVTEKPGHLRVVGLDGTISAPLGGVPAVVDAGQGGLQDVTLAPDFATSRLVYLSFSEAGADGTSGTAVSRGRLSADMARLEGTEVIFQQMPKVDSDKHFGSRLVFAPDGKLFVMLGERFMFQPAQDLGTDLGKVVRLNPDGSIPADNPFAKTAGARPEIWSYGHRNIEAAAVNPATGELWLAEFGPRGGDELNRVEPGRNYGWPLVSWGNHYTGAPIAKPPTRPDLTDAVHQWTPVISPSGMIFYQGSLFPGWRGSILLGGLSARGLVRVTLDGNSFVSEDRLSLRTRVRDVAEGPDGAIYLVTDAGALLRLAPGS